MPKHIAPSKKKSKPLDPMPKSVSKNPIRIAVVKPNPRGTNRA